MVLIANGLGKFILYHVCFKILKIITQWMDWENSYYTMSDENMYTIWVFLKKLFEKEKNLS